MGANRRKFVTELANLVSAVQVGNIPSIVTIEAPSGWGKTRIVKELYTHLANKQKSNYWPQKIASIEPNSSIEVQRKEIEPVDFTLRQSNSLPDFMWIGVTCTHRQSHCEILNDVNRQLEMHKIFIDAKRKELNANAFSSKGALDKIKALGITMTEDVMGSVIGELAELVGGTMPFGGSIINALKKGASLIIDNYTTDKVIKASGLPMEVTQSVIDLVNKLVSLFDNGIPVIIVIEDIQLASPALNLFLSELVTQKVGALVIGTSYNGLYDNDVAAWHLCAIKVSHNKSLPEKLFNSNLNLDINKEEIVNAITLISPDSEYTVLKKIAEKFDTPLTLQLNLERHFGMRGRGAALTEEEIARFEKNTLKFYQARWEALPIEIKKHFVTASVVSSRTKMLWDDDAVIAYLNTDPANSFSAKSLNNISDWTMNVLGSFKEFKNLERFLVAQQEQNEFFSEREKAECLHTVYRSLTSKLDEKNDLRVHFAWLIEALCGCVELACALGNDECIYEAVCNMCSFFHSAAIYIEQSALSNDELLGLAKIGQWLAFEDFNAFKNQQIPAVSWQHEDIPEFELGNEEVMTIYGVIDHYFQTHYKLFTYNQAHVVDETLYLLSVAQSDERIDEFKIFGYRICKRILLATALNGTDLEVEAVIELVMLYLNKLETELSNLDKLAAIGNIEDLNNTREFSDVKVFNHFRRDIRLNLILTGGNLREIDALLVSKGKEHGLIPEH